MPIQASRRSSRMKTRSMDSGVSKEAEDGARMRAILAGWDMNSAVFVVVAYLIGSVSFAVVVSRAFGLPDPRGYGSGNPGATNVLRTGRKAAAALTLLGDGAK